MANRSIAGSRAIVTGATSGIGEQIALELARCGASVMLLARRKSRLIEVCEAIRSAGAKPDAVRYVAGDVTNEAVRHQCVDETIKHFGGFDILVNNAGIGALGSFVGASEERLRQIMEVNFFACAEMIRLSIPALKKGRQPIIVNIGSILGHRGIPHRSEYCASKFALHGLSQAIRTELVGDGVDMLVVSPGSTNTDFYDNVIERSGTQKWSRRNGVSSEYVARKTVQAIRRGKHEIIPSFPGKMLCLLQRICPTLMDRVMRRYA